MGDMRAGHSIVPIRFNNEGSSFFCGLTGVYGTLKVGFGVTVLCLTSRVFGGHRGAFAIAFNGPVP